MPGPDAGECALPTDARVDLEPDFKRFVPCPRRERRSYRLGEVFLNAAGAAESDFGCCGRSESRRNPGAASCLPTRHSCSTTPNACSTQA